MEEPCKMLAEKTDHPKTPDRDRTPDGTPEGELPELLEAIDALPVMPLVAEQVGQLVHDPRSDARSIAEVMRGDPALTAKVLKLVNSPYFGIPGGVTDVTRAISFIGFNALYQLVLTASVFDVLGSPAGEAGQRLFRHSLAVAGASEALAEIIGYPRASDCFTAGLLHDLGKLALVHVAPAAYVRAVETAHRQRISVKDAERELGLPTHDVVGLRLAKRWRFPMPLQAAIGCHHETHTGSRGGIPRDLHSLVDITLVADRIAHRLGYSTVDGAKPPLPRSVLDRLNVLPSIEVKAHDRLRQKMERSHVLMQILTGT